MSGGRHEINNLSETKTPAPTPPPSHLPEIEWCPSNNFIPYNTGPYGAPLIRSPLNTTLVVFNPFY